MFRMRALMKNEAFLYLASFLVVAVACALYFL
jgi:hypothetical protein